MGFRVQGVPFQKEARKVWLLPLNVKLGLLPHRAARFENLQSKFGVSELRLCSGLCLGSRAELPRRKFRPELRKFRPKHALVVNPIWGLGLSSYEARTPSLGSILWLPQALAGLPRCPGGEHGASRRSLGRALTHPHS